MIRSLGTETFSLMTTIACKQLFLNKLKGVLICFIQFKISTNRLFLEKNALLLLQKNK